MTERSPPRWRPTTSSTRSVRFAGSAAVISSSISTSGSIARARARSMIRSEASGTRRARLDRSRFSRPSSRTQWRNGSSGVSVRRRFDPDVQVRDQRRLLVDGDEAAAARLGRRVDDALAAAHGDRAAVGPDGARQDLDEGALAGAVGAHERVDLARAHGQGRGLQRDDRAVGLRDARGLEQEVGSDEGHRSRREVEVEDAGEPASPSGSLQGAGRSTRPGPCRRRPGRRCTWSSRRS